MLNKYEIVDNKNNTDFSFNDVNFINRYNECKDIKNIYVFKENDYTEFWFEINDANEKIEDDIFYKYSLFKKDSDSIIKILTFTTDELYDTTDINYDILLRRI